MISADLPVPLAANDQLVTAFGEVCSSHISESARFEMTIVYKLPVCAAKTSSPGFTNDGLSGADGAESIMPRATPIPNQPIPKSKNIYPKPKRVFPIPKRARQTQADPTNPQNLSAQPRQTSSTPKTSSPAPGTFRPTQKHSPPNPGKRPPAPKSHPRPTDKINQTPIYRGF